MHNHGLTEKIVLSTDSVRNIDSSGVQILIDLHKKAMKSNMIFFVIGRENKVMCNAFGNVDYVLRNDFV